MNFLVEYISYDIDWRSNNLYFYKVNLFFIYNYDKIGVLAGLTLCYGYGKFIGTVIHLSDFDIYYEVNTSAYVLEHRIHAICGCQVSLTFEKEV